MGPKGRVLKMDQKQCTKSYKNEAKIMPKNYNKSREACQGIRADELVKKKFLMIDEKSNLPKM